MPLTPEDILLVYVSYFRNIDSSLKIGKIFKCNVTKKCIRHQSPKPFPISPKNLQSLSMLRSRLKICILPL